MPVEESSRPMPVPCRFHSDSACQNHYGKCDEDIWQLTPTLALPPELGQVPSGRLLRRCCRRRDFPAMLPSGTFVWWLNPGMRCRWGIDQQLRDAGLDVMTCSEAAVQAYHERGTDELVHRSFKRFSFRWTAIHALRAEQGAVSHHADRFSLFEAFVRMYLPQQFYQRFSPTTLRRKVVDVAAKIVRHAGRSILKVATFTPEALRFKELWDPGAPTTQVILSWKLAPNSRITGKVRFLFLKNLHDQLQLFKISPTTPFRTLKNLESQAWVMSRRKWQCCFSWCIHSIRRRGLKAGYLPLCVVTSEPHRAETSFGVPDEIFHPDCLTDLVAINPTQQKNMPELWRSILVRIGENENFLRLRKNTNNLLIFENWRENRQIIHQPIVHAQDVERRGG